MNGIDVLGPQISVLVAAGVVLVVDALFPGQRRLLPFLALAGLATAALWTTSWVGRGDYQTVFDGTIALDRYAVFFQYVFAGVTATVILASIDWVNREGRRQSEYYALVLTVCAGLMLLAGARDLITIFIALELSSIPQYILAGWGKDAKSSEAGLKYLLLGAVASSLLLYGMALLYGVTGTTILPDIAAAIEANGESYRALLIVAMTLLIAGFGFKMAVVPFQMWVPDVYQGAPTPVAAFLSVGSKAAAFAVAIRVFFEALGADFLSSDWSMIFAVIAAVSMTLGNLMAIVQSDIKRMLGYSSIAQAGNFLVGLAAISVAGEEFTLGASGILLFVAAYAFTNLGAFVAVIAISQRINSDRIADYAGMWKTSPFLALGLAFCLVSLTGIPPTVGFWAKLYIFNAAVRADLVWLVIVGVLNSVVSAYYYLGVVRVMFLGEPGTEQRFRASPSIAVALTATAAGVLVFGIVPAPLMSAARDAVEIFAR
ncbi:MAG: NADH-quinone oxidoreductase subunit N [Tepidiforma sp.]|jgi:NADH-quinone oxidoreductase subunit N|uniref:NADH-quinone oxidoreductase subunit N n=1 Tax=Tepidiforma sp. TaxID=2682230 RepID=UPI0021DB8EA3|nr:NADH-quinone oxidoreductase subunit N [Tepidiforma sp.]MCX7617458.1 NADH-quinone oxidoreductase subunit N [Tepidiforma sp.]GIW17514.1 MAG: NADH-quinone oxidoreductase subunit N [Tepidiforma sp.]